MCSLHECSLSRLHVTYGATWKLPRKHVLLAKHIALGEADYAILRHCATSGLPYCGPPGGLSSKETEESMWLAVAAAFCCD